MSIAGVVRELLVRYLDVWTPTALHARRATFVYAGATDRAGSALAALPVFAEFADRMRDRRLTVVLLTSGTGELAVPDLPREVDVLPVTGPVDHLPAVLGAAGAARSPLLVCVDAPDLPPPAVLAAVTAGRPAELLLSTNGDARAALLDAGFPLTAAVELVEDADAGVVAFATSHEKSLEAFKNALWSVDGYAGVRFRDPADPDGHLLDITLHPHPGPLRRELLSHLAATGGSTVTELRRFTLTGTVYRSSDATPVLTSLLATGAVTRDPAGGRLAGDVRITPARGAAQNVGR